MQKFTLFFAAILITTTSFAKIWRVNNNAGVTADFTTFNGAATSSSVLAGDTLHIEPSATTYATGNFTLTKRLIVIGAGYFLNLGDATFPNNAGLQYATESSVVSQFTVGAGAESSKFMGLRVESVIINASSSPLNLTFEKLAILNGTQVRFASSGGNNNSDNISFRKCIFHGSSQSITIIGATPTVSNLIIENCIFYNAAINLGTLTGTGNIIRNNSFISSNSPNTIVNAYIANNIFGVNTNNTFTNCTIKNNLFQSAQPLPGTATNNQVSVNMANVYVGGSTGSLDSRVALKAGSPAIGAGVTISGYTPDCGAYGATDPYKLSGIPAVPSIYSLNVPTTIPTGSATMNVTFSSRNNN